MLKFVILEIGRLEGWTCGSWTFGNGGHVTGHSAKLGVCQIGFAGHFGWSWSFWDIPKICLIITTKRTK